ncbi:hypothetical protein [Candidatus Enterovibrio escicola]|uniref:Mobile element protein n=1 Tax=Candidatus Enterovibrio escicola TaxID=1927127 RepID=A0A2A5SYY6_9GAMM|nr:hypothetical protein [Candidatus Enterovibrio escacola]PCS21149.1 Mobile element protein [Candidatus Enterovibrio escacola]
MGKHLISSDIKQRNKPSFFSVSEVINIHHSGYLGFKTDYIHFIYLYLTNKFPELINLRSV